MRVPEQESRFRELLERIGRREIIMGLDGMSRVAGRMR
jgi:hypothetical protein